MNGSKLNGQGHSTMNGNGNANGNGSENLKNRYSDEELEEFRQLILPKLDKARKELNRLTEAIQGNPHDIKDTSASFKILEEANAVNSKEENGMLADHQNKFITVLEKALVRIENKSYGICKVTGKLIPKDRLRAAPGATMSIEAKLNQSK